MSLTHVSRLGASVSTYTVDTLYLYVLFILRGDGCVLCVLCGRTRRRRSTSYYRNATNRDITSVDFEGKMMIAVLITGQKSEGTMTPPPRSYGAGSSNKDIFYLN